MLAICVPVRDTVTTSFSYSLAQLTAYLSHHNIEFGLYYESGSILPEQRNKLVTTALSNNADEILWLDSDMIFPANIYHKLASHNKHIVGCNYSTRTKPYRTVAFTDVKDYSKTLQETTGLHSVKSLGMGCMLVDIDVYKDLSKPWYYFEYVKEHDTMMGEDVAFGNNARQHGYETFVDCDTSQLIQHTGQSNVKLTDAIK